jgi:L-asparaginase/Glu-tRNA(Gln) amidotransferase subunit D
VLRGIAPLDSCNIGPSQWRQIAEAIFEHYDEYAGFVVLHGTDTYAPCKMGERGRSR